MWFSGDGGATITGGTGGGNFNLTRITGGAVTTALGATDTITFGAAGGTAKTNGTDTVQAGPGATTISALAGSATVAGGTGKMTFIEGAATATVTAGSGIESFTLTKGQAGGALTIKDFVPGSDTIHLAGYQAADVTTQIVNGTTYITLADHSTVTLTGFANANWHLTPGG
jgi:Ca2+-binding RTX toxin-like protein